MPSPPSAPPTQIPWISPQWYPTKQSKTSTAIALFSELSTKRGPHYLGKFCFLKASGGFSLAMDILPRIVPGPSFSHDEDPSSMPTSMSPPPIINTWEDTRGRYDCLVPLPRSHLVLLCPSLKYLLHWALLVLGHVLKNLSVSQGIPTLSLYEHVKKIYMVTISFVMCKI